MKGWANRTRALVALLTYFCGGSGGAGGGAGGEGGSGAGGGGAKRGENKSDMTESDHERFLAWKRVGRLGQAIKVAHEGRDHDVTIRSSPNSLSLTKAVQASQSGSHGGQKSKAVTVLS